MIRDLIGVFGFVAMCAGLSIRYGWDFALIIGGVTMLILAVMGAFRK